MTPVRQPPELLCPTAVGRRPQKPPACRDEGKTPPFLQRACCPNGETGQTPQNLKTTTETATITSLSEPSTASCEAVSTLIQATIYKGLSRVCFIPSSLTTLFLIPPFHPLGGGGSAGSGMLQGHRSSKGLCCAPNPHLGVLGSRLSVAAVPPHKTAPDPCCPRALLLAFLAYLLSVAPSRLSPPRTYNILYSFLVLLLLLPSCRGPS